MSPTQRSEDRAAELAVAAPDAGENLLLRGSQQGGTAVVEDHAVEFARPVGLAGSARAVEQCLVRRGELLVRRVAQQGDEGADVRQPGYDLLNGHHGYDQGSGVCGGEVDPTDAHLGRLEVGAETFSCIRGEHIRVIRKGLTLHLAE